MHPRDRVATSGHLTAGLDGSLATYEAVAEEYYNELLHPTCADFRLACRIYLSRLLQERKIEGEVADVGSGRSLLFSVLDTARTGDVRLTLIDSSQRMLANNVETDRCPFDSRVVDVTAEPFGLTEFDWIFCILGDPYNTLSSWRHISRALRPSGKVTLLVPSARWTDKFRSNQAGEMKDAACFVSRSGKPIYLPSFIYDPADQRQLMSEAGLQVREYSTIRVDEMPRVLSPKISRYLDLDDPVIEAYEAIKAG